MAKNSIRTEFRSTKSGKITIIYVYVYYCYIIFDIYICRNEIADFFEISLRWSTFCWPCTDLCQNGRHYGIYYNTHV